LWCGSGVDAGEPWGYNSAALAAALSRLPLTLVLAVFAFLELVLHRIGLHLSTPPAPPAGVTIPPDPVRSLLEHLGPFSLHLTGLLALCTFTWGAVIFIRDRHLLRLPDRMVITFLAGLFLPLAAMGLVVPLPTAVAPHLSTAFGLLLLALVIAFLRRPAPLRTKLGVAFLVAPMLLRSYWTLSQQIPALAPSGPWSELPAQLFEKAEDMVVVGGFASFLFFAPFPRRANVLSPIPVTVAAMITAGVALLIRYHYPEAMQASYHGLGLNVPPPSLRVLIHLSALFFFVLAVGSLALRAGAERATAVGLVLVAVSGFQLQLSYQLLLTLCGVMLLIRAGLEGAPVGVSSTAGRGKPAGAPSSAVWTEFLQRLSAAAARPPESGEAVILQNHSHQIAHLRGMRDGVGFSLRVLQGRDGVERLEVLMGEPPREHAPVSLRRKRGLRGKKVSARDEGDLLTLGLPDFDHEIVIHDRGDTARALLSDAELQQDLLRLLHGWLGLWPGEGLHYIARPPADGWPLPLAELAFSPEVAGTEELCALIALLATIARRLKVPRA
jgi:hypothetical protein